MALVDAKDLDLVFRNKGYFATAGPVSVPNGSVWKVLFSNPAGSGLRAIVDEVLLFSESQEYASLRVQPTTNLPTTALSVRNKHLGAPIGVCTVKSDVGTNDISGGVLLDGRSPLAANTRISLSVLPIVFDPGISVGLSIDNSSSGGTGHFSIVISWVELPT